MTRNDELPSYRQLPVRADAPPGSSWGLWGNDDQLGTLNLNRPDALNAMSPELIGEMTVAGV